MKKLRTDEALCSKVLQIGLGRFGVHLNKHLEKEASFKVTVIKNLSDFKAQQINFSDFEYVFLTTPDSFLKGYIKIIPQNIKTIHFSGFYYDPNVLGIHPLKSFSKEGDFDLSKVDYVIDGELDENLKKLFLNTFNINGESKKFYHTYISMAANTTQLLMNKLGSGFEKETNMSSDLLKSIVIQSLERERLLGDKSFSGPWTRKEEKSQFEEALKIKDPYLKDLSVFFKNLIKRYNKETYS